MGNASSGDAAPSVLEPAQTSALEKIVSQQAYSMSDPVWATFFTMEQPLLQMPIEKFQGFLRPYMHAIAVNTLISGNFRMLVRHATKSIPFHAREKAEKRSRNVLGSSLVNAVNVLFVIRHFCLHFAERASNENKDIAVYFKRSQSSNLPGYLPEDSWRSSKNLLNEMNLPPGSNSNDDDAVVDFIDMLFTILLEQPPNEDTHDLHLECINILLTLLAAQAYEPTANAMHDRIANHVAKRPVLSGIVKRFLLSYLDELAPPNLDASAVVAALKKVSDSEGSSWSMMEYFVATDTEVFPLADRGILLFLNLMHTNSKSCTENVFRRAFIELVDRDELQTANVNTISFSQSLNTDISSLLLYTFITLHEDFLSTLCDSLDHELFTLPLLQAIYEGTDPTLLFFNLSTLHKITERPEVAFALHTTIMDEHIPWYTERYMIDISMGSIVIVIVLRFISKNMATYREAELHTLCFSIVFNLMQFSNQLHQYATQTIILMLEHWVKKEAFIQTELDRLGEDDEDEQIKLLEKQKMYIECIHLVLGLISVCLTPRLLPQNPQMMYSLLHASSLFSSLANHPDLALQMSDDHTRIQGMLAYFRAIIDQEEESNNDDVHVLSVERVFEYIQHGSKVLFPKTSCDDDYYPQYYYKYEEDPQRASAFFGQYIWQRIVEYTSDFQWAYDKLNDVKATSTAKERD